MMLDLMSERKMLKLSEFLAKTSSMITGVEEEAEVQEEDSSLFDYGILIKTFICVKRKKICLNNIQELRN